MIFDSYINSNNYLIEDLENIRIGSLMMKLKKLKTLSIEEVETSWKTITKF